MIGGVTATAVVSYRGVAEMVRADRVHPIPTMTALPPEKRDRPRFIVDGMPGMIVDRLA